MKEHCRTYDLNILGAFADNELAPDQADDIRRHVDTCPDCSRMVEKIRSLSDEAARAVSVGIQGIDADKLAQGVGRRVADSGSGRGKKVFDYFSIKSYVKIATVAAMAVIAVVFYQGRPVSTPEPSAIVTSVDAGMASVMIFETQNTSHTVIWFTET